MPDLEHCDDLFLRYFDRWYSDEDRKRRGFPATKPDMMAGEPFADGDSSVVTALSDEGSERVLE